MDMTPTRRSKCKTKNIYTNPVETFQHKSQKIFKGIKVRGLNGDSFMDYNSDMGYIEEVAGELYVVVSRLTTLTHIFTSKHKVHILYTRLADEKIQHYICLGKLVFTGPIKQIKEVKEFKYGISYLQYLVKTDHDLRKRLQSHVDYIVKRKHDEFIIVNQDEIMTLDNTTENAESTEDTIPSPSPVTILLPLSTKTDDEINAAFTLDLLIIPHPSRSYFSFKISIKRKQSTTQTTKLIVLIVAKK